MVAEVVKQHLKPGVRIRAGISIRMDHRTHGDKVFERFSLKRDGAVAYYRKIAAELRRTGNESQVAELAEVVEAFAVSNGTGQ